MAEEGASERFDVVVVGAGAAGLAVALGLSRAGLHVASVGRLERSGPGRTVALLGGTLDILDDLGVLAAVEAEGAPMRAMRLVDDTGSLFAPRPVTFRASEAGRDLLGWNIENARLAKLLARALGNAPRFETDVAGFDFGADAARLTLADGRILSAALVVGADGGSSPTRKAAGIDATPRAFGQTALTLCLRHTRPHDDCSTEFHTRQGPFTLVPLPPAPGAPHRSSLVWLMRDASFEKLRALSDGELAAQIRERAHAMLGEMEIEGARGAVPMTIQRVAALTGRRVALVGDAAHAFPPIGAQGLNLGLRDVAGLAAAVRRAHEAGADIGAETTLANYAAARRPDIATRTLGVGLLNVSLLTPWAPVDFARGVGLSAMSALRPLRRLAMREGLNPFLGR